MKKLLCIVLLFGFVITLGACGNEGANEFKDFDSSLNDVKNKEKELNHVMDDISLKQLDDLSKTDTTDKDKKAFNNLQNNINRKLIPKLEEYETAAKKLPAESEETKNLKSTYLKSVKDKKAAINDLKVFVDLCNQAIKAGARTDVNNFKHKLEENNKELRHTAEKELDSTDSAKVKQSIEKDIMPLINKQIKDLNKAEITNNYVNSARKNAIEMYYSLQNYYETRVETIDISDELSKIDHKTLPKESEDLEKYDAVFDKQYNNIKEDYN